MYGTAGAAPASRKAMRRVLLLISSVMVGQAERVSGEEGGGV